MLPVPGGGKGGEVPGELPVVVDDRRNGGVLSALGILRVRRGRELGAVEPLGRGDPATGAAAGGVKGGIGIGLVARRGEPPIRARSEVGVALVGTGGVVVLDKGAVVGAPGLDHAEVGAGDRTALA